MKLYKYLAINDDIAKSIFVDHYLKFTQSVSLNDPFESFQRISPSYANDYLKKASKFIRTNEYLDLEEQEADKIINQMTKNCINQSAMKKILKEVLRSVSNDDALENIYKQKLLTENSEIKKIEDLFLHCSLTDDLNNNAMWCHYANNETGIVIEFTSSHPFFRDFYHKSKLFILFKIRYLRDNAIPKLKNRNFLRLYKIYNYVLKRSDNIFMLNIVKVLSKLFLRRLTVKESSWKYENEYRLTSTIHDPDCVILKNGEDTPLILDNIKHNMLFENNYDNRIYVVNSKKYNYKDAIYLYKYDPNIITAVYLGLNIDSNIEKTIVSHIRNNKLFEHVKILKAKLTHDSYTRLFHEI